MSQVQDETFKKELEENVMNSLKKEREKLSAEIKVRRSSTINNWMIIWLKILNDKRNLLSILIEIIFYTAIAFSAIFMAYYMIYMPLVLVKDNKDDYFKAIEMIFIGPLPLIIIFTFYNYYMKVFRIALFNKKENLDSDQRSAMRDIGITKYLFISILISTIFIMILQYLSKILTSLPEKNDSGTTVHELGKVGSNLPGILPSDLKYFVGMGFGFLTLVFLIIYINSIQKHTTNKDSAEEKK